METINDYKRYLDYLHSKQETPEEIIRDVVKEGAGLELVSKQRIVAGEVNEVYDILLDNRSHVILRISPNGSPDFQQEQWAMQKCRDLGVPVPEILLITYSVVHGKEYGFCLMKKIGGNLLERGDVDFSILSIGEQRSYINQGGKILSRIHSIQTTGFGKIIGDGKSHYSDAEQSFSSWVGKEDTYETIAREADLDLAIVRTAFKTGISLKKRLLAVQPCLNHGDYFPKHLTIRKGRIAGILDWGEVRSDSPIYDFANWDFWVGKRFPIEWLKDGYSNRTLFNDEFEDLFHFMKITIGLEVLDWYSKQEYKGRVEKTKEKLVHDISYFK